MRKIKNLELWLAAAVIGLISAAYIQVVSRTSIPAASGFFGHSLGIVGSVLMLMTEILYSIRKRYQFARWGKLQDWLSFHIFTGIVGPFLVLLHSSWKFNGLAGILTLFTLVIVFSGFIGRYFYTAIPRSTDGKIMEEEQVSDLINSILETIQAFLQKNPQIKDALDINSVSNMTRKGFSRTKKELRSKIDKVSRTQKEADKLYNLFLRQSELQSQLSSLDRSRRLLAIWHTAHVPFGLAMFFIALVHIFATLYYATLLH